MRDREDMTNLFIFQMIVLLSVLPAAADLIAGPGHRWFAGLDVAIGYALALVWLYRWPIGRGLRQVLDELRSRNTQPADIDAMPDEEWDRAHGDASDEEWERHLHDGIAE